MEKLNPAVLSAVATALSNDRYPKDGVGYVLSAGDKRDLERTIREQMVAGVPDEAITAAIAVFTRPYAASSPDHQADWAKRTKADLDALVAELPVLRAQISGGAGGELQKAKDLAEAMSAFSSVIGLDIREDGPDTDVTFRSLPALEGASQSRLKSTFSRDRRGPDSADGEFIYAKGAQALTKFFSKVTFDTEFADPDEARNLTKAKFKKLLDDPAINEIHFVGSWAGDQWGVAGYADWNLIVEYDKGNFVHLKTSGGWQ